MWIIRYLEKIIENPEEMKKTKRLFLYFGIFLVVTDAALIFLHMTHPHFPWDWVPGFSSLYGFISTYLIIVISKWVGHTFLMKSEDYYD